MTTETIRLEVSGMHCGSCVGRVEKILHEQPDVLEASVNLANQTATVTSRINPGSTVTSGTALGVKLSKALTKAGYATEPELSKAVTADRLANQAQASQFNLLLAIVLTLPVFVLEMGAHLSSDFAHWVSASIGLEISRWVQMVLSAIVLFIAGREFFRIGVPALLRAAPEMNSLVAIGAFAAWFFSAINTVFPGQFWVGRADVYFESAAVIVSLILLGRYLESKARGKTSKAISALADLQPETTRVKRDGMYVLAPIESIIAGETIQIKPGERIALDGLIVAGSGRIDESMLTGEAMPVLRQAGDAVTGGTINTNGALDVEITATGSDTTLARIIALVEEAQNTKLPIQALVDKVAMWFVPAVLVIAALTFVIWAALLSGEHRIGTALIYAVSVLIVACPCAMGLATPLSVMVGIGRAAKSGLLFRNGQTLQELGQIDLVAFDKTGTLTAGKPTLTRVQSIGWPEDELLNLVASVQAQSEHPIANAVLKAAENRGLVLQPATDFVSSPGLGVSARIGGARVLAGNRLFLKQYQIDVAPLQPLVRDCAPDATTFLVAVNGKPGGAITIADTLREQTRPALKSLRALNLELAIISGDRTETVKTLADELGVEHAVGDVLPAQKQAQIQQLRANSGRKIAFVGDGINDAPALADAQVGIAIGAGTDVAIESADLVLAGNDLNAVARGVMLSRATLRNIRQNLFWAFIYNLLLIPIAAGLLVPLLGISLSPMLAAGAMSLSSLFVVFNALRLNTVSIDNLPEAKS